MSCLLRICWRENMVTMPSESPTTRSNAPCPVKSRRLRAWTAPPLVSRRTSTGYIIFMLSSILTYPWYLFSLIYFCLIHDEDAPSCATNENVVFFAQFLQERFANKQAVYWNVQSTRPKLFIFKSPSFLSRVAHWRWNDRKHLVVSQDRFGVVNLRKNNYPSFPAIGFFRYICHPELYDTQYLPKPLPSLLCNADRVKDRCLSFSLFAIVPKFPSWQLSKTCKLSFHFFYCVLDVLPGLHLFYSLISFLR